MVLPRAPANRDCDVGEEKVGGPPLSTVNRCGHSDMVLAAPPSPLTAAQRGGSVRGMGALSCEKSWEPDSVRAVP